MIITNSIQVEDNFLFKMVETPPAQLPPMRRNSSCLAAGMTGLQMMATGAAGTGRWTGVNFFDISVIIRDLCPRYDSQGNYLGSLPDLEVARHQHACTGFVSDQGEQVSLRKLLNSNLLRKKGWLVSGGFNNDYGYESSTEIYLPSNNQWTRGANLPRLHSKQQQNTLI